MDVEQLIAALRDPAAYPEPPEKVELRQTHVSAVFLTDRYVYKVKKPVRLGFLDYSDLEQRKHYCEEEVRLNRRLAPHVYLGVVPVTGEDGRLRVEGEGAPVEWAVKMLRLPDEATLEARLLRGTVSAADLERLARRIAAFHRAAARGTHVSKLAAFGPVARNTRENLELSGGQIGATVRPRVFDHLVRLNEQALFALRPLIASRAARNVPCECHGDLHLDHIYLFPGERPPEDLVVVDCIEFSTRFRYIDPVADMAFVYAELCFYGRWDLARVFGERYFAETGDDEGRALLPLYASYRARVRAMVEGMALLEKEISDAEHRRAFEKARGHWLTALALLEEPRRRPCLVLVGGLPGTGKSTLARALGERAHFEVIRSDVVRKRLAGFEPTQKADGLYTPQWNERVYGECLAQAEQRLCEGGRVVVDANFRTERLRGLFFAAATKLGVPALFLECAAPPEVTEKRLAVRAGDASDADVVVYRKLAREWEPVRVAPAAAVPTEGESEAALTAALEALEGEGFWGSCDMEG